MRTGPISSSFSGYLMQGSAEIDTSSVTDKNHRVRSTHSALQFNDAIDGQAQASIDRELVAVRNQAGDSSLHPQLASIQSSEERQGLYKLLNTCSNYNAQHLNDSSGMPPFFPVENNRDMFGCLKRI